MPQKINELSSFIAAKPFGIVIIVLTFDFIFSETMEESPPIELSPQVITEPSLFKAAKAEVEGLPSVLKIFITFEVKFSATAEESPPRPSQVTTEPSLLRAAKA